MLCVCEVSAQVATLTISPHWPFLHGVKIDSTNLLIELNLSSHIGTGFHHLWHGIKTGCLTNEAKLALCKANQEADQEADEVRRLLTESLAL